MIHLLSPSGRPALRRLARERALLVFDFDGTLAPLVAHPGHARLRRRTRRLLHDLGRLYPCAILSGRRRADLAGRIAGVPLRRVVGNHGAEDPRAPGPGRPARALVHAWIPRLRPALAPIPGAWIEDKAFSLTVHVRRGPRAGGALRSVATAARRLPGARVVPGKASVNILPAEGPNKGTAFLRMWRRSRRGVALFVGDDRTDEDVFRLRARGLVSTRIGRRSASRARYYLRGVGEIDRLLSTLIALRQERALARR